ncbi:MAG: hypothetical protein EPN37_13915 [Chitinophagaceae bacterium]|nr:MAG: hypothetical protein EPN37_13915 [Chitinophagaceae bacterium]
MSNLSPIPARYFSDFLFFIISVRNNLTNILSPAHTFVVKGVRRWHSLPWQSTKVIDLSCGILFNSPAVDGVYGFTCILPVPDTDSRSNCVYPTT